VAKRKKAQPWDAVFSQVRVLPREPFLRLYPLVTDAELNRAEAQLGHRLPRSYREFMKRFGPGEVHGWARLHQVSPWLEMLADFTLVANTRFHQERFRSGWRAGLIYFACDACGDQCAWDPADVTQSRTHEYRVYYFPDKAGRDRVELAETFWGFLDWVAAEWGGEPAARFGRTNDFDPLHAGLKKQPNPADVALWLAWNKHTARDLALSIRDRGQTDAFPILADALQEAGCTSADLLDSCRTGDPDIDGKWVLRVLLGES
jgi:hypothetical protein